MKKIFLFAALVTILTLFTEGCKERSGKIHMEPATPVEETAPTRKAIREVVLSGSGYDLGFEHGQKLKAEIEAIVSKWKENTRAALKKDPETVLDAFFEYAHFEDAIKTHAPELYEEVQGIAEGSGQAFRDILVLNLLDEFWVYIDNPQNHHCSDMGVPAQRGRPAYIAQNMDLESYTDGFQILLRLGRTAQRPAQMILTYPGLIAANGLNEAGIGVVVNTIMQLQSSPDGLPVAFVVRKILSHTEEGALLNFVQEVKHASGQNYILGIRDSVYDFEASANKVVRYDPRNPNGTVYHTNHPVVNNDLKPWHALYSPDQEAGELPLGSNSYLRFAALEQRMRGGETISDTDLMEALRSKDDPDNPVCRNNLPGKGGFTFASTVMTLSDPPKLQVTAGPPDESEYKEFTFELN
ncbi:MAG: C45 family autoproteolytic acyltransferase/hydrolase [Robiginitalea sp.]